MPDAEGRPVWNDRQFRPFYTSQFVKDLWQTPRWTVTVPKNKMPMDIDLYRTKNRVYGAQTMQYPSLDKLDVVCHMIPSAVNNTFYLDAIQDKYVVLDIEPDCPPDIRNRLMKMPYLYAETSMSGMGLHLIFPLPECFKNYPIAQTKVVMKEEHGYYEILLCHYVTFTRNHIPLYKNPNGTESFEALFEEMCKVQKETHRRDVDISLLDVEDIPAHDDVLSLLKRQVYEKTPAHFNNDMSKYEFGYIAFLNIKLKNILQTPHIKSDHEYTDAEKATFLFIAASEMIPYRPKHDEYRNGMPWLLSEVREVMAKNDVDGNNTDTKKKKKKK